MTVWTNDMIQKLSNLWLQVPQLSTQEIGRRMGMSKNAVVGKAHRIPGLPERPSPIRRGQGGTTLPAARAGAAIGGATLAPLVSTGIDPSSNNPTAAPRAWVAWCGGLSAVAFNTMRRATHHVGCPVVYQKTSLRLWECTCGVSQPGSDVVQRAVAAPPPAPTAPRPRRQSPIVVRRSDPDDVVIEPPTIFKPRKSQSCCWPISGEGKGMRFCDSDAMPGKPYCVAHGERAYVKRRIHDTDVTAGQPAA